MKYKNVVLLIIALFVAFPWACGAQELDGNDPLADLFSDTPEFLPEEQAFQFDFVLLSTWRSAAEFWNLVMRLLEPLWSLILA